MASIGIDLASHRRKGLLKFYSVRPTLCGLESHLVTLHKLVTEFKPEALVMDPITNLTAVGNDAEIKGMLTRVIDFLKGQGRHHGLHQPDRGRRGVPSRPKSASAR